MPQRVTVMLRWELLQQRICRGVSVRRHLLLVVQVCASAAILGLRAAASYVHKL